MDLDTQTITFIPVAIALVITPGVDFAIVIRNALLGRQQGIVTSAGTAVGLMVHTLAAALGLSAVLAASALTFTLVKIAGAMYLLWLGVRALWSTRVSRVKTPPEPSGEVHSSSPTILDQETPGRSTLSTLAAFRQGLLTNVLNPKAPLVFLSIMPQFIPRGAAILPRTLLLSAILISLALAWFIAIALLVQQVRPVLSRPAVRRAIDRVTGVFLVGLGVRLFLERRPVT